MSVNSLFLLFFILALAVNCKRLVLVAMMVLGMQGGAAAVDDDVDDDVQVLLVCSSLTGFVEV